MNDLVELLSSMRFAISLLTMLAIASVIGTVVPQNQPPNVYLNLFGQFWDPVFSWLGLYGVYNSGWFIAILGFLVLSTTLCIIRQFTPMLREIRSFREHAREASLRHFAHRASFEPTLAPEERSGAVAAYLTSAGFRFRVDEREGSTLIAAKKGNLGRIGYFFAHGAIVMICLGGLLDSNLPLSMQIRLYGKTPVDLDRISTVPPSAWLEPNSLSYRGDVLIPEGATSSHARISTENGDLLQPLPFEIKLKKFHVDHYESGMAKRYASDIVITDNISGEIFEHTLEVNKPFEHRGITLYQASFDNNGTVLNFTVHGMTSCAHTAVQFEGLVGWRIPLSGNIKLPPPCVQTLEEKLKGYSFVFNEFRPVNVENVAAPDDKDSETSFFGSAAPSASNEKLRSLGPLYTYTLVDPTGQTREFNNYMNPIQIDGRKYLISGVRAKRTENVSWFRIPLDENDSADTWFAIQQSFFDPTRQAALIERFVSKISDKNEKKTLGDFAGLILTLFAKGGEEAVAKGLLELNISVDQHEEVSKFSMQTLQTLVWEAWMIARETAGKDLLEFNGFHATFIYDTFLALDSSIHYGSPFYLQLTSYELRQTSVLQATRSPGKLLVYLGSLLLVLGVFSMLYIRERRLFVLFKKDEALVAMSSDRKTIDLDETFAHHRDGLAAVLGVTAPRD